MGHTTIVWIRNDLRLADNPALHHAAKRGTVIPIYILDDTAAGDWKMGGASRWWLHYSLEKLQASYAQKHVTLLLRKGDSQSILEELIARTGADAVYWNRRYEPYGITQDKQIKESLKDRGLEVQSYKANLLYEPWEVETKSGDYYKVFTPFWKQCLQLTPPEDSLPIPTLTEWKEHKLSESLESFALLPTKPDWATGLRDSWQAGEDAAHTRLDQFLDENLQRYAEKRDFPGDVATSQLSPHLHFGEISPRQIWNAVHMHEHVKGPTSKNARKFLSEVGWREFSHNLLYYNPTFPDTTFREEFTQFPWNEDTESLRKWQKGQTGYPIIDAGMRELWHSGIMHNRVRMVVASFLVKHLLIPWQEGEKWFWDTLVDADLANNSASWQWVAGCGADAAPYFRVFNPILQGKKFDPKGDYVRKWVPEVRHLPNSVIHCPWEADEAPPKYPAPIIAHEKGRERALKAYEAMKGDG